MAKIHGRKLKLNKTGSLLDIIYICIVVLFFSMVVLIGVKVASEFNTRVQTEDVFNQGQTREQVDRATVKFTNTIDNSFLFLVVFMCIAILVLAALVRVHPIFIPFYFIGWIFTIFLAGIFSNVYQEMAASDTALYSTAQNLTFITNIMSILPIIIGVVGIILMVVMYKLWSTQQLE